MSLVPFLIGKKYVRLHSLSNVGLVKHRTDQMIAVTPHVIGATSRIGFAMMFDGKNDTRSMIVIMASG